jgi:hypothetical protein
MEVSWKMLFRSAILFLFSCWATEDRLISGVLLNAQVFLDCLLQVKEVHGRRSSTTEVKRAIHLIVSSDWNWICEKNPCVA